MKTSRNLAILSTAIAAVLTSGAASALTPGTGGIVTDADTITVNNVTANDNFKACKIVDVVYDSSANTVSYAFTSAFTNWQNSLASDNAYKNLTIADYMAYADGTTSGATISTPLTDIDQLTAALATSSDIAASCVNMTTSGTSATATVPYGAYLVLPKVESGADVSMSKAYGAMMLNLNVKEQSGSYVVDKAEATADAKAANVGAVVKAANKDSFAIGENITYTITATAPTYPANAANRQFRVEDSWESGLSGINYSSVSITSGGNTYTVDTGSDCGSGNYCIKNGTTTVGFVEAGSDKASFVFNDLSVTPSPITITYTSQLDSDATLGNKTGNDSVNENSARIGVPQDFYNTSSFEFSDPSTVTAYTFGIRINKLDENNQALTGATFQLCSDSTCNTVIATIDMTNDSTKEYKSLAEGTYYLKETVAPTGYVLPSAPTTVQIARASSPSDGYFVFSITNTKTNFNLPFTGGRGVVVYAILGVSIITVASVYYTRKKKQA